MNRWMTRAARAARHPLAISVARLNNTFPVVRLLAYVWLARRQGVQRTYFILSFDCDTERDIEVVEAVHTRLADSGIVPVYAVPGQLLEQGVEVYRRLAQSGAEFLNHGYAIHSRYHPHTRTYESTLFYDRLPPAAVLDDIRRGHQAHLDVLGRAPQGFRVPHFATFQQPEHLAFLHRTLHEMGYTYSSSTMPRYGLRYGPLPRMHTGLYEIPVSGCYDWPLKILDSWGFRYDPNRQVSEAMYRQQLHKMAAFFASQRRVGLLNYYADPSQVYDWPDFFASMEQLAPFALTSYRRLLQEVGKQRVGVSGTEPTAAPAAGRRRLRR